MKKAIFILFLIIMPTISFGESFKLNPGDLIYISLPGDKDFNKEVGIDQDGFVILPQAGKVKLGGKTLADANKFAKNKLTEYYRDLTAFDIKLREHRLLIRVLGDVVKPGKVLIPEGSNVQTAIIAAGGLAPDAQLDQVHINRNNKVLNFNYTKYLSTGDLNLLPKLHPLDIIFVPTSPLKVSPNKTIRVFGSVNTPGRYVWSSNMTLFDLIASAGGTKENADLAHVSVMPGKNGAGVTIVDLTSGNARGKKASLPEIKPGSTVIIPDMGPGDKLELKRGINNDTVYLFGAVASPGRYIYKKSLSILDIVAAAGGPTPTADLRNIHITHTQSPRPNITDVNLSLFFDTGDSRVLPSLKPGDTIYIPSTTRNWLEKSKESTVRVLGAVGKPGRYDFDDSMTILDLLAEAGGPASNAYLQKIIVVHMSSEQEQASSFDLIEFAETGHTKLIPVVRAGDTIFVPDRTHTNYETLFSYLRDLTTVLTIVALIVAI